MVIAGVIAFLLAAAVFIEGGLVFKALVDGHDDGARYGEYRNKHSGVHAHLYDFAFRQGEKNNETTLQERNRKKFNRD